jgi:DNA-binding NarL/FixJ family response regulator
MSRPKPPQGREWIELDGSRLRARVASEWQKAYTLAKALALRWAGYLNADLDDAIQEALAVLADQLEELAAKGVTASSGLCRIFYFKALQARDARQTRGRRECGIPDELVSLAPAVDDELQQRQLAHAFDQAVLAELQSADATDRVLLRGLLIGRSNRAIAAEVELAESTVHERKQRLLARLAERLKGKKS